jgi:putative ABC transport system permease protein
VLQARPCVVAHAILLGMEAPTSDGRNRLLDALLDSWDRKPEIWESDTARVVVVNQTFARRLFGDSDPIGRRIRSGPTSAWSEIVGVVRDVRQQRLDLPAAPEYYTTFREMPMPFQSIVVRGRTGRPVSVGDVRDVMRRLDSGVALANLMPLDEWVSAHTRERQFALWVLSGLALMALVLGAIGVYGAVSYSVIHRHREIGIRLALGATAGSVRGQVLREGLRVVAAGLAFGVLAALMAAPLLRRLLYGVEVRDPVTFLGVPLLIAVVAGAACWRPALTATRMPLADVMRTD